MPALARLLRTQIIPPKYYWLAAAVGAAYVAVIASFLLGREWVAGAAFAAAALVVLVAVRLLWTLLVPPRFETVATAIEAALVVLIVFGWKWGPWLWGVVLAAVAMRLAAEAADPLVHALVVNRARRRARSGCCVRCGYSLRGDCFPRMPRMQRPGDCTTGYASYPIHTSLTHCPTSRRFNLSERR